ncbi:hypothetical protein [Microbacterium sp. YJN-G]|uniref:hypothetical protein n=1 Tax=Microbacterium sp. YJN-G TaxID=2763257 RepID=UPI0018776012|nr:hypothetical protein [Microbacterium sp. YJN-G]
MTEPQPEYVWAYSDEKPRRGRVWLIIGLSVAAIAIAAVVFGLFFRPGTPGAEPSATPSPSATASPAPTSSPSATPTPTPTPTASPTPVTAPPPPADPDLATFRDKVTPVLETAATGLGYARDEGGMAAMQDIMLLQQDAERLSDTVAPSSIESRWSSAVHDYAQALETLRSAYERGQDVRDAEQSATRALELLGSIVGP